MERIVAYFKTVLYTGTDKALADIERAIEIYPDRAVVYFTRGSIYRDMGDGEKARTDFTKACDMGEEEACADLEEPGE